MTTSKVFVYGTLKKGYWNNTLLKTAEFLGYGRTTEAAFTLYDGSFPYVKASGDHDIFGEIYEVDDKTLSNLDRLEGVPTHYVPRKTEICHFLNHEESDHIEALMYVASPSTEKHLSDNRIISDKYKAVRWDGKHA